MIPSTLRQLKDQRRGKTIKVKEHHIVKVRKWLASDPEVSILRKMNRVRATARRATS